MSFFEVSTETKGVDYEDFVRELEKGTFFRRFFLGVSEKEQAFLHRCPISFPGVICIGTQGSGKTTTARGILSTLNISSMSNLLINFIDSSDKGAGDYSDFFEKENVVTTLFDTRKLVTAITYAYEEVRARGKKYQAIGSYDNFKSLKLKDDIPKVAKTVENMYAFEDATRENIKKYNDILSSGSLDDESKIYLEWVYEREPLTLEKDERDALLEVIKGDKGSMSKAIIKKEYQGEVIYLMVFEEFHKIINSPELDFLNKKDDQSTIAWKLLQIARTGRSFGFSLFLLSQRATYTEIPNDLKVGCNNPMIHKLGSSTDANSFNIGDLNMDELIIKGRVATELGMVQFPFFEKSTVKKLEERFHKPFCDNLHYMKVKELQKALSGEGTDGMILATPFVEILANFQIFNPEKIAERFLNAFDFMLSDKDHNGIEIDKMYEKDGKLYPVITIAPPKKKNSFGSSITVPGSYIKMVKKELEMCELEDPIVLIFGKAPANLKSLPGHHIDLDDLNEMATILDNKSKLSSEAFGSYIKDTKLFQVTNAEKSEQESSPKKRKSEFDDDMDFLDDF